MDMRCTMLLEKDILIKLSDKLKNKSPHFNIHIFLQLMQITTRPLQPYPAYEQGINAEYYTDLLVSKISKATASKNGQLVYKLMQSVYQIMVCFCYIQHSLSINLLNEELLSLLFSAIDKRVGTTDEERCAEKSLLKMLVRQPQTILSLIGNYAHQLIFINTQHFLEKQIICCGNKLLKDLFTDLSEETPWGDTRDNLSFLLDTINQTNTAANVLPSFMSAPAKSTCQLIIGHYLLDTSDKTMTKSLCDECTFSKNAVVMALKERSKIQSQKELSTSIASRQNEGGLFDFFSQHPKAVKLDAAKKYSSQLNNNKSL